MCRYMCRYIQSETWLLSCYSFRSFSFSLPSSLSFVFSLSVALFELPQLHRIIQYHPAFCLCVMRHEQRPGVVFVHAEKACLIIWMLWDCKPSWTSTGHSSVWFSLFLIACLPRTTAHWGPQHLRDTQHLSYQHVLNLKQMFINAVRVRGFNS